MALNKLAVVFICLGAVSGLPGRKSKKVDTVVTCPGFPGYCSESYPGQICLVVCARGRNNVPQCQDDGSWTDIPRCIEHEPGQQQQRTEHCPGVPGYCSLDLPGGLCEFQCPIGAPIRSSCTPDGTWEPYPTCSGDPRETQDGCNPCPGPLGAFRNRTEEGGNSFSSGGRKTNSISTPVVRKEGGQSSGGRRGGQGAGNRGNGGGNRSGGNRSVGGNNGGGRNRGNGGQKSKGGNRRNGGSGSGQKKNGGNSVGGGHSIRVQGGAGQSRKGVECPGSELQVCIDVCPGFNARVFGACVAGCAKRCPDKK